ncbi:uncharacterized protein LOC102803845 [Saccoglossus kowalevskii]|uniref:Zinc finger protein 728-like n=1 Tax=Saccoglossus kowalevskii TaxID=10224 RepID=A0ABM0M5D9_SACKO|nr:PREDICTED: zinc finger protein 728-like [Saccoglossus kowalevskii]
MEVYPTTEWTEVNTNLIFQKVQELMQKKLSVFFLISEDNSTSEYIGSNDLVTKFETCGLKAKPYDINRTHTHPCIEMASSLNTETTKDSEEGLHDRDEDDPDNPGKKSETVIDDVCMAAKRLEEVCNSLKYSRGNDGQDGCCDDEVEDEGSEQDAEYDSFVCSKYADAGEDLDDVVRINENKTVDAHYEDENEYHRDVDDDNCDADYENNSNKRKREKPKRQTISNDTQHDRSNHDKKMTVAKNVAKRKYKRCTKEEKALKPEKIRKLMEESMNEREMMCQKCGKGFALKSSWKIHVSNNICFQRKCRFCHAAPMMYKDWMFHMIANHATKMTIYRCELCGKEFLHNTLHKKHLHRIHGKEWKCFTCNICGKMYRYQPQLKFHKIQHHEKKNYTCCFCDKKFATEKVLLKHQNQHTEGKKYECELCGGLFVSSSSLGSHMHVKHIKNKYSSCQYCEKSFYLKSELELHLSSVHDKFENLIQCDYCDKVFKHELRLKVHIRRMHISNPVQCEVCGKQFRNQEKLSQHMFVHSDVKEHRCDLCGREFKQKHALKRHMSVHNNIRPWQCDMCGYTCKLKGNLVKHMKTHNVK